MTGQNVSGRGSLLVVGAGMRAGQCTTEAIAAIRGADIVLSVMGDALSQAWLGQLNPRVRSLQHHYAAAPDRPSAYKGMVAEIMDELRAGASVCAVFYGHPGVFVTPSHRAVSAARAEGFEALMLPGVSAEACLFADLGIDPGDFGCQSYEAHDFFVRRPSFDTSAALILWQIAVVGDTAFRRLDPQTEAVEAFIARLTAFYPADHKVVVYAAATLPVLGADIKEAPLCRVPHMPLTQETTLYVPPLPLQS